jgi:hypothetical protein
MENSSMENSAAAPSEQLNVISAMLATTYRVRAFRQNRIRVTHCNLWEGN